MALISRRGSLGSISSQGVPETETVKLTPRGKYSATDADVDRLHDIADTYTTLSAVNPDRYPQEYKMLLAYPKGFSMKVTYFHWNRPDIDIRSMVTDISFYGDAVHNDLTKIVGLEMKLEEQLQYEERPEDKTVQLMGTGIMFPGFEPYEGDLFFLEADHKNIYIFRIDKIVPTTYRQERYYRVTFNAFNVVTEDLYHRINDCVVDTCYFDQKKYFGESEYTFLTKESYYQLQELRKLKASLTQDLINVYYDESSETFLRPDDVYDPYVVEYLRRKLSVADMAVRPKQIYPRLEDYSSSIWYKFIDAVDTDFADTISTFSFKKHNPYMYDSDLNALAGRVYVALDVLSKEEIRYRLVHGNTVQPTVNSYITSNGVVLPLCSCCCITCPCCQNATNTHTSQDNSPYYIFGEAFYLGHLQDMTDLERLVWQYFNNRDTFDVAACLRYISPYKKHKKSVQTFYTWALYLELIDMCILHIK